MQTGRPETTSGDFCLLVINRIAKTCLLSINKIAHFCLLSINKMTEIGIYPQNGKAIEVVPAWKWLLL